jgi:hypothetical protein
MTPVAQKDLAVCNSIVYLAIVNVTGIALTPSACCNIFVATNKRLRL